MKPLMLLSIVLLTAIILAASFGLHIMPIDPIYNLAPDVAENALYVCPTVSSTWDSIAMKLHPFSHYISMAFFFVIMLLLFSWGWALYQNLLKDAFKEDAFKKSWAFTKVVFWLAMVVLLLLWTPNHYKSVRITGAPGNWILCENNTPGAIPVLADAVKR